MSLKFTEDFIVFAPAAGHASPRVGLQAEYCTYEIVTPGVREDATNTVLALTIHRHLAFLI